MRLFFALTTLAAVLAVTAPAQEEGLGATIEAMKARMDAMQAEIRAAREREAALGGQVRDLQTRLLEQQADADRRLAAMDALVQAEAPASELERAVAALEEIQDWPAAKDALSLGGYFDIEFRDDHTKDDNSFDQHRLILQMAADILDDAISFKTEIEIEGGGADASFLSGNEIVVEFAELHFHFDRAFNVKAGALLVPFNRFNTLHDSPLRDLTDRPLVARRIVPTTWVDAGIGVYGAFDLGPVVIDYDIIISNGLDEDFSATVGGGFRDARNSLRQDNNDSKMILGRIGVRPDLEFLDSVYLGVSFAFGRYDDRDAQDYTLFGFDWALKKGPFELIGEYACFDFDRSPREVALGVPGGAEGFYVQLNFHFFPEAWRGANRFFTEESTFTLVFRVGTMDTDDSTRGIDRALRGDAFRDDPWRYTVGFNFRPIEKTVIKIEYQFWVETSGIDDADNDRFVVSFATYF